MEASKVKLKTRCVSSTCLLSADFVGSRIGDLADNAFLDGRVLGIFGTEVKARASLVALARGRGMLQAFLSDLRVWLAARAVARKEAGKAILVVRMARS